MTLPDKPVAEQTASGMSSVQLFRAHAGYVARFLRRMGVAVDDVDDLVQEVFIIAHRRGGYALGPAAPTTWLAAIAIRLVANYRRAHQSKPQEDLLVEAASSSGGPLDTLIIAQSLRRVQRALDSLLPIHRAIFILIDLEGEAQTEVAQALNLPVGTVYSRAASARRRFQQAYARLSLQDDENTGQHSHIREAT